MKITFSVVMVLMVLLVLTAAVVGWYVGRRGAGSDASAHEHESATAETSTAQTHSVLSSAEHGENASVPRRVSTLHLVTGSIIQTMVCYGTVGVATEATQSIAAPWDARVQRVLVSVGQTVAVDQVVMELVPSPETRQQYAEAEQTYLAALRDDEQMKQRLALKLATAQEVSQARQTLDLAALRRQQWRTRGADVEVHQVRATVAGTVLIISVQEGQTVLSGAALCQVAAADRREVRLGIDANGIAQIRVADELPINLMRKPDQTTVARVRAVSPILNPITRLADVIVAIPIGCDVLIGDLVRSQVLIVSPIGLLVPRTAVVSDDDGRAVFTVESGKAMRHSVQVAAEDAQHAAITGDGLKAGDEVIVEADVELVDGAAVLVDEGKDADENKDNNTTGIDKNNGSKENKIKGADRTAAPEHGP